jgi:hypothetical protein
MDKRMETLIKWLDHVDHEKGWELRDVREYLEEITADLAAAKAELKANSERTYCCYCGEMYELGDWDKNKMAVDAHVRSCPKHPYAEIKAERDEAIEWVRELLGWESFAPEERTELARAFLARMEVKP